MKRVALDYYASLGKDYATKIRQLVPGYDEMVQCIIDLVRLRNPKSVLDIGSGIGNVTEIVLRMLPEVVTTAVDGSEPMVAQARSVLERYGARATVLNEDLTEFAPRGPFDVAFSNLVLHNLTFESKQSTLRSIGECLSPGGVFVWGDLIRYDDRQLQEHFVESRRAFALERGCAPDLVEENFRKETTEDFPMTIPEMLDAAREAGFKGSHVVWARDTFAVLVLSKTSG